VQHAERLAGWRRVVEQVTESPDILELQVFRVVEVDMGMRYPVDEQRPRVRPVPVAYQLASHGHHYPLVSLSRVGRSLVKYGTLGTA